MKIKEVQCSGVITVGAKSITVSGSQLAIVGNDDRIVALLGPANDSTTQLEAELMLRSLQGENAMPANCLLAIVRSERRHMEHMARALKAVSAALQGTSEFAAARADSLTGVIEDAEAGVPR